MNPRAHYTMYIYAIMLIMQRRASRKYNITVVVVMGKYHCMVLFGVLYINN